MKNNRKSIIIIPIVLLVVVSIIIAVGIIKSNHAMASEEVVDGGGSGHTCTFTAWTSSGSKEHYRRCTYSGCNIVQSGSHTGMTHANKGYCTVCGATVQNHSKGDEVPGAWEKNESTHKKIYSCTYPECSEPYIGAGETHSFIWFENTETQHIGRCTVCLYEKNGNHSWKAATCTTPQKCEDCGQTLGSERGHDFSEPTCTAPGKCSRCSATSGPPNGLGHNYVDATCTKPTTCTRCNSTLGEPLDHIGGTHSNGGKCTRCNEVYQTHNSSFSYYSKTESTHTPVYTCTCGVTSTGTAQSHSGATHANGGICTVSGCGYKYQTHNKTTTIVGYTDKEGDKHTPLYSCSYSGCKETIKGTAEAHTGATHENGGKCTAQGCGTVYEKHEQSQTVVNYINKIGATHTPVYACTFDGCDKTITGTAEKHIIKTYTQNSDGTHQGTCEICKQEIKLAHTWTEATCTTPKTCSECKATEGNALGHTGATHANGGKCTRCQTVYEQHGQGQTAVKYINTVGDTHTPVYACTYAGCQITYTGTAQNHTITTWTNNSNGTHSGTCSACKSVIIEECSFTDGTCDKCKAEETQSEICVHSYEMKNNSTQHWEECTKCNLVKTNSVEEHNISTWTDNEDGTHTGICTTCKYETKEQHAYTDGICDKCKAEETKEPEECVHTYETKYNNTEHWEECTKCKQIKTNSLKTHVISTWKDNGDGTHSGICTECNQTITEEHSSETCDKCEYDENNSENNNNNNNDNENNNSNNNNDNNNNSNNNNNSENNSNNANIDNTQAGSILPNAGRNSILILISIVAIIIIAIIAIKKIKEYKDI